MVGVLRTHYTDMYLYVKHFFAVQNFASPHYGIH